MLASDGCMVRVVFANVVRPVLASDACMYMCVGRARRMRAQHYIFIQINKLPLR
jgi:hypothetical protein